MDSHDNFRERFDALEQQTARLQQQTYAREVYTRTVERRLRWWRGLACGVGLLGLVRLPLPSGTAQSPAEPPLAQRVAALEQKLQSVTVGENELVITGVNLRIVNGLGATPTVNGLENLIVGYNEERFFDNSGNITPNTRTGSHNVVVGSEHNFSRFGGIVVGLFNEISGDYSSVSGGSRNTASGTSASVSGGVASSASGTSASVSGGQFNTASGFFAAVSGGTTQQGQWPGRRGQRGRGQHGHWPGRRGQWRSRQHG